MMRTLLTLTVLFTYVSVSSPSPCFEEGTEYHGVGLEDPMVSQVTSASDCQELCQHRTGCNFFTWVGPTSSTPYYRNTCWLKGSDGKRHQDSSCVSGPRVCSNPDPTPDLTLSDGCCDLVLVNSTNTEILDYQRTRLGYFTRHGQMGGRPTYRQLEKGQKNYLYYQGFMGVWFVGEILGANERGLKNWGDAECAEELTSSWSYYQWGEGTAEGWVEDKGLKVTCEDPAPHLTTEKLSPKAEACTFGESCSGCAVTAMVNGVTYCCASDCDHGEVNVWEVNGRVQCKCFH